MAASAATRLPPEILAEILQYFGPLQILRDLESRHRRETKRVLAACSLVCKYWAKKCRPKAFDCIKLKPWSRTEQDSHKYVLSLSALVSQTPQTLRPVSEYIKTLHLYREINDEDWYDSDEFNTNLILRLSKNLILQLSNHQNLQLSKDQIHAYETCAVFLPHAEIHAYTNMYDFDAIDVGHQSSIAGPPTRSNAPPLFCHRVILERVYLRSLSRHLRSFLKSLRCIGTSIDLEMTEVHWLNEEARSRPLHPLLDVDMNISAKWGTDPVKLVWSAFKMIGRSSIYYADPLGDRPDILLLYESELEIMSSISKVLYTDICHEATVSEDMTRLQVSRGPLNELEVEEDDLICAVSIRRVEDPSPVAVTLEFFAAGGRRITQSVPGVGWNAEQCEYVRKVVLRFEPFEYEYDHVIDHIVGAQWEDMFELILQLEELEHVEMLFAEYSDLARFVDIQPNALRMVQDLVKLRYDAPCEGVGEVHFHTRHNVEMCISDFDVKVKIQGSTQVEVYSDDEEL
ncbi:hypothetical protein BDW22DRAFT_720286 [Trametopsis cervina]|nr:hypothetical protein BDW22DRAFT_720286 [Trametopsis cervina]